jgi:hypothetical protein
MDVNVRDEGTVVLLSLQSDEAHDWVDENVAVEDWQWMGQHSFCVDHRFAVPLIEGMIRGGLEVQ